MNVAKNKYTIAVGTFLISACAFLVLAMPFKLWLSLADITEMRPNSALTPVLGMIFGMPAALGCAAGNFIADLFSGYELTYSLLSIFMQLLYGMVPYYLWRALNSERNGDQFRLDSISRILKFWLVMLVNSVLTVAFSGVLNHAFSVVSFFSEQNLFLFLNSFDSGLLFGCPFLVCGHLLRKRVDNARTGEKKKVMDFSLSERMILNTIITGIGICCLVGLAVYITDKTASDGSPISLWGRVYLFQSLTLNCYFALSMGFMWFAEKRIARPVEQLARIAGSCYGEHSTEEQRRQMIAACGKYASDSTEAGELARSYISMAEDLDGYISNLKRITAEKERINAELSLAAEIQANMLPRSFPAFPDREDFEVYATMTPAKEVGGDFYDFFLIDENRLAVVIADVSGKGVPAAMFMATAKTMVKNYARMGLEPDEVFTAVNRQLCEGNEAGLFVTTWLGVLELSSGRLSYANAGHNPPLLYENGCFSALKCRPGFVLAGLESTKYRKGELTLKPGSRLFLYTDGVTEAADENHCLYGEQRLLQFMNAHGQTKQEELLRKLKEDIDGFAGTAPQFDDITMLILDYRGSGFTEKAFPADEAALSDVSAFLNGELEKADCPPKAAMQLDMSIEEVFVNIARYAYPDEKGEAVLGISFDGESRTITLRMRDKGVPFDPLARPDPDITLPAEERSIGGLGIFMMKKVMDSVHYSYTNGENVLTMSKKI